MGKSLILRDVIKEAIDHISSNEGIEYVPLKQIYFEVSRLLEKDNTKILQSQIRGRLQENCIQCTSFNGKNLFITKELRSGLWKNVVSEKHNELLKYIRYTHNYYIITNDNWKTFEKVKEKSGEYVLENNLDIQYEVRLMLELGITKAKVIIDEYKKIRELLFKMTHKCTVQDGYGFAFEVFAISAIHNYNYETVIDKYIVHGDNDGSIDAIVYDSNDDTVYVYQIKIGDIPDTAYDDMNYSYYLCMNNHEVPFNGKDLYNFIEKKRLVLENKKIKFRTISSNSKKEFNIPTKDVYEMFVCNKLLPLNNNLILNILKPTIKQDGVIYKNVAFDGKGNYTFYLCAKQLIQSLLEALSIHDMKNLQTVDFSRYFYDNVRGEMGVNPKMRSTIINEPEEFVNYNVGIDITGEVHDLSGTLQIRNPIINNGQQTIMNLVKTNQNLDKIKICVHVKNETRLDVKSNISRYTNEQCAVKAVDILSINYFVRELQREIFKDGEYFLNINSTGVRENYDLINSLYSENKIIALSDFLKLYFSVINSKNLGNWKNTFNQKIQEIDINQSFDFNLALKVCKSISMFEEYLNSINNKKEKDDLRNADLAFMYLLCKENLSLLQARKVIDYINKDVFIEKNYSKLIDVYKSSAIYKTINYALAKLNINKKVKVS